MNIFSKIKLVFTYGDELEAVLTAAAIAKKKNRLSQAYNLNLCLAHKQERNHSQYAERNCDYCKLLRKLQPQDKVCASLRVKLTNYLLDSDYLALLERAIETRYCTSTSNKEKHKRALELISDYKATL